MLLLLSLTPSTTKLATLINRFYQKNDFKNIVVLDPFMGGGTSIVEASKINARTIGIDIDPIAWFVTKKEVEPYPAEGIRNALQQLEHKVGNAIQDYYKTMTPSGVFAPIIYSFWVDVITCPQCQLEFEAHPHFQLSRDRKKKRQTVFCKQCHTVANIHASRVNHKCKVCNAVTKITGNPIVRQGAFTCPGCGFSNTLVSLVSNGQPLPKRLFAIEYEAEVNGELQRFYKAADEHDVQLVKQAQQHLERIRHELPIPLDIIPTDDRSDARPVNYGYKYYHQLFTARQLLCLSLLWREIRALPDRSVREYLTIAFSDSLASNNLLCSYAFDYRKLTPLFGLHAYNVVTRPVENNVWGTKFGRGSFIKCVNKMLAGKEYAEKPYELQYEEARPKAIITGETAISQTTHSYNAWKDGRARSLLLNLSSTKIGNLEKASVDIILTDPPYFDNLSYSELSDFFYVWLKDQLPQHRHRWNHATTPYKQALYVPEHESGERFVEDLKVIFSHCHRVLKPNGLLVFTFHHRDCNAWKAIARSLWAARYVTTNVFPVRSEGKSGFHSTSGTIKWDAVLVCRKRSRAPLQPGRTNWKNVEYTLNRQRKWISRLSTVTTEFNWADALSLGYALALQVTVNHAQCEDELSTVIDNIGSALVAQLTEEQRGLLRRR